MPVTSRHPADRRFLSADAAADCPAYDLTGYQQRRQALTRQLDGLTSSLNNELAAALRQLLNLGSLDVSVGPWRADAPAQPHNHWLAAIRNGEAEDPVLLAMDNRCLYSLSELFFGGDPAQLSDSQLKDRPLADTERRLVNRIFNALLALVCPALSLDLDDWQSQWLDYPPQTSSQQALWSEIRLGNGDAWQVSLACGWPLALDGHHPKGTGEAPADQAERLRHNLQAVTVRLKANLASLTLNLEDLAQLREGDILPMELDSLVTASAGSAPCLRGEVCEHGDRLALRIRDFIGDAE